MKPQKKFIFYGPATKKKFLAASFGQKECKNLILKSKDTALDSNRELEVDIYSHRKKKKIISYEMQYDCCTPVLP